MTLKLISQGAEAKIFLNEKENLIIKDRIQKLYRIPEIDEKIRKQRTKAEKKLLEKSSKIINAPDPFPLREFNEIEMPFIEGEKLSQTLDCFRLEKQKKICRTMGEEIEKLHEEGIIHGDLTTSNMVLSDEKIIKHGSNLKESLIKRNMGSLYFIDFGLGYISKKREDKAVDLHLLKQALEAKHFKNWKILFEEIKKGYKNNEESNKVLERLKTVEKRGRYKH